MHHIHFNAFQVLRHFTKNVIDNFVRTDIVKLNEYISNNSHQGSLVGHHKTYVMFIKFFKIIILIATHIF